MNILIEAVGWFGALGFIVNSSWNGAWPSAVLNVVWAAIGVVTLSRQALATR